MNKKLTIITINLNNLAGLQRTIESVVNQTWQEFEYIVIDGGSTDGSAAYIKSQSKNFDYWVSESDKGIYNAMNKGILKANGEYLLFLNSGDHFFNWDSLGKNHHVLKNKDLIYFNLEVIDNQHKYIKEYPENLTFSYFLKDTLPHPATFIKKEAFKKINFYNEEYTIVSDWKFFMDGVCKYNLSYCRINSILSSFYLNGISCLESNRGLILKEKEKVLNQEYDFLLKEIGSYNKNKKIVENLRRSRIIRLGIRLGFINKF